MALLVVLRKMLKNRWLTLCLLLGLLIAIALVSSIPIYSSGVLQRLLTKEIEQTQLDTGRFAGSTTLILSYDSQMDSAERYTAFYEMKEFVENDFPKNLAIPHHVLIENYETDFSTVVPDDPSQVDPSIERTAKIKAATDLADNIRITTGRSAADQPVDGVYEVVVTEKGLIDMNMSLNQVFVIRFFVDGQPRPVKVKPVGTFVPENKGGYYWSYTSMLYDQRFYMDMDLFMSEFVNPDINYLRSSEWYYALDYREIKVHDIDRLMSSFASMERTLLNMTGRADVSLPLMDSLEKYLEQELQMKLLLLTLNVPILLMLCFYFFMVSSLIVEADRNEIALYKSRGASRWQIVFQYFNQGFVLTAIGIVAGPYLGLLGAKMLGAPLEFMEFSGRSSLPVSISRDAYIYSIYAIIGFMIMLLIPAFKASRGSIIDHKRQMSRNKVTQIWKKFYLDIVMLGIAGYGIYSFNQHRQILELTGADAVDLNVSPLLFIASTFFILGTGLLFLRLYPLILRALYLSTRRWLPVPLYETLLRVSRSFNQYQFIILFLMMTLATGLFSANVARTLNNNMDDRILYHVGSDVSLMPLWQFDVVTTTSGSTEQTQIRYIEPPFDRYLDLPEVADAAKVYRRSQVNVQGPGFSNDSVRFMAIESYDFGNVAWFRNDLLQPYHINQYLNLLTLDPSAILISRSLSEHYSLELGDTLNIGWPGVNSEAFTIYGVFDYWPTWNPVRGDDSGEGLRMGETATGPTMIVANLQYVQEFLALEPYEIWLRYEDGASSAELYQSIEENDLRITSIRDSQQEITAVRNGPGNIGINGATTLGFITSLSITFLGMLIYWILAIRKRSFEFGMFRAMGVSLYKLIRMIVWEQLLISIVASGAGLILGGLASDLFVPFFSVAYSADDQVPPFLVFSQYADHLKLYGFLVLMLLTIFAILTTTLIKLKFNQVIKMGEE